MDSVGTTKEEVKLNTPVRASQFNRCKGPLLLDQAREPSAVSSLDSDNYGSECNNKVVTETEEANDGSAKTSSPSGM